MKRFAAVLLCFSLCYCVQAQQTVIPFGQRLPNLYYWDTNWLDSKMQMYPSSYPLAEMEVLWWVGLTQSIMMPEGLSGDAFWGRVCYTDAPMKVIGIAAPVALGDHSKVDWKNTQYVLDTVVSNRLPEYFQLYQMGGEEYTDYTLLGEVRWDTVTPQYKMVLPTYKLFLFNDTIFDLYEAYFDKPVIVHDTFCIGGTTHNNMYHGWDPELFPLSPTMGNHYSDHINRRNGQKLGWNLCNMRNN